MTLMRKLLLSVALVALGALGVASFASAGTAPDPTGYFEGNINSCGGGDKFSVEAVLDLDGPWLGGSSGSWPATQVSAEGLTVDITGVTTVGGQLVFDWASNLPVDLAVVKQASGGAYWLFNTAQTAGTLASYTSDRKPSGGISHVLFCYHPKLTVTKTAVTKVEKTYTWEIAKKEKDGKTKLAGEVGGSAGTANYEIELTKTLASTRYSVSGVITVKNNSATNLLAVTVTDMLSGNLVVETSCIGSFPLEAGGTKTCEYSAGLPDGSARTNTASADSGSDLVGDGTGTASLVFDASTPVTTVNGSIGVTDDFATPGSTGDDKQWKDISSTTIVSYAHTFTCGNEPGSTEYENTASIDGTDKSSSWTIEVTCAEKPKLDLVVAKTADGDWFRNNVWSVTKSHSPAGLTLTNGNSGNVDWLINVSKTAEVYGIVSGTITIENPNDFEVTGVTIDESLADAEISCKLRTDDGKASAVDGQTTIPGGGILDCEYYVLVDEPVPGEYTNEVDVTTDNEEISGEAEDGYTFADEPSVDINASITVADEVLDAKWTATNGTDGDRTLPQTFACGKDAGSHSNTVVLTGDNPETTAVETDYVLGSATDSVTVTCNEVPPTTIPPTVVPPVVTPPVVTPPVVTPPVVTPPVVTPPVVTPPVVSPEAPLLPPTAKPKPKPKPKPAVCTVIAINKKSVATGKKSKVTVKLTAGGKVVAGTKVRFTGAGINKVVKTNKSGVVIVSLTPRQSGIITVRVVGKRGCSTQRLGVVGAFEPPVTG